MTRSFTPPASLAGGRYVLGEVIGEGGTAAVVRATDKVLRVERAIKLLMRTNPEIRATLQRRLQAEARAMARLRHPNVLTVHDVGQEGELDYIVMDLAEGGSVADQLERDGFVPVQEAILKVVQVLSALGAAHAAGVVHRDVKPHNLLLDRTGRVLLADFGIALVADDDRRTRAGVALGSIAYMPHEQRVDAAAVGPEADLYAVGATLYHMVTGANPVDLFLCADDPDHPRWSTLPLALRPVIRRACATRPEDRYPSALALSNDLMKLLDHTSGLTVPERVIPEVPRTPTLVVEGTPARRPRWAVLVGAVGLAVAAAVGWLAVPRAPLEVPPTALPAPAPAPVPAVVLPEPAPEPAPEAEPEP
ncbi:MAG: serine/threonine-protein kinase, partial [Myxococcota bacterium]